MVLLLGIFIFLILILLWVNYSNKIEPYKIRIQHYTLNSPKITNGFTIMQLSDFHLRKGSIDKVEELLRILKSLTIPDLILLTGDYMEEEGVDELFSEILSALKAKYGIYAIFGNHEYYRYNLIHLFAGWIKEGKPVDQSKIINLLEKYNVKIIDNDNLILNIENNQIQLIGIHDAFTYNDNHEKALKGFNDKILNILMTHSPEAFFKIKNYKFDLVLAGHTHGGQIRLPFYGGIASRTNLPKKLIYGFYKYNNSTIIITNGLGEGRLVPFRFRCPPEINLISFSPS